MFFQRFLVLLGVENNILKVYQNPPIRKLMEGGGGGGKKGDFKVLIGINIYLPYKTTIWEEPAK